MGAGGWLGRWVGGGRLGLVAGLAGQVGRRVGAGRLGLGLGGLGGGNQEWEEMRGVAAAWSAAGRCRPPEERERAALRPHHACLPQRVDDCVVHNAIRLGARAAHALKGLPGGQGRGGGR